MNVQWEFSQDGFPLTFIHANGYPLDVYKTLLTPLLQDYRVAGIELRPFWGKMDPNEVQDWRIFRDDYLEFLRDDKGKWLKIDAENKVIALGHSIGAMTSLLAAIKCPELFKALILLEPVLFPRWYGLLMRLAAPTRAVRRYHPLIQQTLQRKTNFPGRQAMFANYRKKARFQRITDDILMSYVEGLSRDLPDGTVTLRYQPEWEARIYETAGITDRFVWRGMNRVKCPVLIIRGEESDTFRRSVFKDMVSRLHHCRGITIDGAGHLAPLEEPARISEWILDFLDSLP
jgi:pimeloyl-ACP methyl ester carboxylesterase